MTAESVAHEAGRPQDWASPDRILALQGEAALVLHDRCMLLHEDNQCHFCSTSVWGHSMQEHLKGSFNDPSVLTGRLDIFRAKQPVDDRSAEMHGLFVGAGERPKGTGTKAHLRSQNVQITDSDPAHSHSSGAPEQHPVWAYLLHNREIGVSCRGWWGSGTQGDVPRRGRAPAYLAARPRIQ